MITGHLISAAAAFTAWVVVAAMAAASFYRAVACHLADRLRETCHYDAADLIDPRTKEHHR
ncbi:hypothetical protein [Streptomyces sp. NPDC051554]|uniref:hypothetical protein n=1 Tax=Streptomyces sp. NPDC051554 TaxID=3365656 RepID=UPI003796D116